ncbi:peroxiredoxin family protein [Niabella ginsengisoli]|uniref:TlpA family protein disulfide reductase n=1 Tax=Niabella ginsengisoli TaxID=522298 RepID=A0ABS9SFP5_9BACT|nr:TlpA disulfide reductase family protein [Niabella ginsengisoli]MCH5597187.1 TlpA family protein disulfide reductase [Niabella ginsengisoli]
MVKDYVLGKLYPEFELKSGKRIVSAQNLKGKVVFINFWFDSCPPCRAEMRGLDSLYSILKDSAAFEFISITFEDNPTIKWVRKKRRVSFPMYSTSTQECQRLSFGCGYPTNIILDKRGVIRYINAGGFRDADKATQYIMEVIKPKIVELL